MDYNLPSEINRSRISQAKIVGFSRLYCSILDTTAGVATFGFDPPINPGGLKLPANTNTHNYYRGQGDGERDSFNYKQFQLCFQILGTARNRSFMASCHASASCTQTQLLRCLFIISSSQSRHTHMYAATQCKGT